MTNNKEMTKANNRSTKAKKVICIETGKIYTSATEVAKEIGCHVTVVTKVCRGYGHHKTAKGKHFCYVDENNNILSYPEPPITEKEITVSKSAIVKGKGRCHNGNTNAVLCISTGEIYTSCTDAAEHGNVTVGQMSAVCRRRGYTAKGKKYCYVKDINLHLDEISDAISKKNLYTELLAKENRRKQLKNMIADYKGDIARLESELAEIRTKMESARAELEDLI